MSGRRAGKLLSSSTAKPGIFCPAMVTRYSGSPTESMETGLKTGVEGASTGNQPALNAARAPSKSTVKASTTAIVSTASGMAASRFRRKPTIHARITGIIRAGIDPSASAGARHSLSRTPASRALAMGLGIFPTQRPSAGIRPVIRISTPQVMSAPNVSSKPPGKVAEEAKKAAPGVDQAMAEGARVINGRTRLHSPMARVA